MTAPVQQIRRFLVNLCAIFAKKGGQREIAARLSASTKLY
jgi:hypothetical protein